MWDWSTFWSIFAQVLLIGIGTIVLVLFAALAWVIVKSTKDAETTRKVTKKPLVDRAALQAHLDRTKDTPKTP